MCDVGALAPDVTTVDALARLQLTAQRRGRELRLEGATRELAELLAFLGLDDVLPVEPRGQAEEREEGLGVEEERELDEPAV